MNPDKQAEAALAEMYSRARRQFGSAVKGQWFYDGDFCPGCSKPITAMKVQGGEALSLNAFIYREYGMLIGYMLCGACAERIFRGAQRNPGKQSTLHTRIEERLSAAYLRYLRSLDA